MVEHKHIVVSKKLVAINSASTMTARFVNFFVLLWVYQYLLSRLPPEEFAVLPVVTTLMVFGPLFLSFFVGGFARYTIDAYAKGDFVEVTRISSSLFPVLLGAAALFLPAGLVFAANIEKVFNIAPQMVADARLMMALLILSFSLEIVITPFKTAYAVRQRYFEQSMLEVGRDLLRATLVVGFLLLIEPAVLWVVVATFISETLLMAIFVVRALQMVPELHLKWGLFDFAKARVLINFGMWTTVGRLGAIMFVNAATLVLNLYGTAIDVTSYHIGATFFRQLHSTINVATLPLQPAITAMNALEDRARLASTVMRGGRYALWTSMIVATPLTIYADAFVDLYLGPDYELAAYVIVLFMIMMPFIHPTVLLPLTAIAMARVREFYLPAFLFPLGGLVAMLILVIWFDMGAFGVTLALTVTTLLSQLGYFWGLCLRLTGVSFSRFRDEVLVRGLMPAACGAVVWLGLLLWQTPTGWGALIAHGATGALVYLAALFGFCLNVSEKSDLRGLLARVGVT